MVGRKLRPILENFANFVVPVMKAGATYITAQVWSIGRLSLIGSYHNLLPGKQAVSTLSFCLCCVPAYAAFNFANEIL